jgi:hypothetical protein
MYHMIATKDRAHLSRGQHDRERQITPEGPDLPTSTLGSIQCREQQRGLPGAGGLAYLLKSGNGETGPARETDCIAAPLRQPSLDAIRELRR